jgi:sensor histidine kinase YesM
MLSQIQPHFLYNALTAIKGICVANPKKAEETIVSFSDYLRGNMDSLKEKEPIPFRQELSHTRNYLSIEQMRFQHKLSVEYHTPVTDFKLPALTLQPIVENAVRYGVTKKRGGGTVRIITEETLNSYVVKVLDDGLGLDPMIKKEDGRTHIGISNVRDRLKTMSGGTLEIESVANEGTTAIITVPKEEKTNEP